MKSIEEGAAARSVVAASWERCVRLHSLHPRRERPIVLSARELKDAAAPVERHLALAETDLCDLADRVARAGFFLSFVDADGTALLHMGKIPGSGISPAKLQAGMVWREDVQGTNGTGTDLILRRPTIIHRHEHFFASNMQMTCIVSPLYGEEGALVGILNITTLDERFDRAMAPIMLTAVTATAQRIEALWFREAYRNFLIVSLPERRGGNGSVPMVAVDDSLNVVGATHAARVLYAIHPSSIDEGLSLHSIVGRDHAADLSFREAERIALQKALSQSGQNVTLATRKLGISRATMYRKMRSLSIHRRPRKPSR